jgi:hypothetical protein
VRSICSLSEHHIVATRVVVEAIFHPARNEYGSTLKDPPWGIILGEVYTFLGVSFLSNLRCRSRLHLNRFSAEVAFA